MPGRGRWGSSSVATPRESCSARTTGCRTYCRTRDHPDLMRHFYRSHLTPAEVVAAADEFFPSLGLSAQANGRRSRTYQGVVGTPEVPATMRLLVRPEGGHYTFVEVETDQIGESRLDRN